MGYQMFDKCVLAINLRTKKALPEYVPALEDEVVVATIAKVDVLKVF